MVRTMRVIGVEALKQRGRIYLKITLAPDLRSSRTIEIYLLQSEYEFLVKGARRALAELKYGNKQSLLHEFVGGAER